MNESASIQSAPVRILIVDDHPNTASMLARVLDKFDIPVKIDSALSGEEALEIASEEPVDILITDFIMGGISGLELIENLRREREPAYKILITAYEIPGLATIARSLNIQDCLIKPVQPQKIREIVARVLREIRPEGGDENLQALHVSGADNQPGTRQCEPYAIQATGPATTKSGHLSAVERWRVSELVALNELVRELGRFNSSAELFECLPHLVCKLLNYPAAALWEVDGTELALKSIAGADSMVLLPLLNIGTQQAAAQRQTVELSCPENGQSSEVRVQTITAAPIFADDRVRAVLCIHTQRTEPFLESDRALLEMAAEHIGITLEHLRLLESAERERKRMLDLFNSSEAILILDGEGRLELANPTGRELLIGMDASLGRKPRAQRGWDTLNELLEQARSTAKPARGEADWPDGRIFSVFITHLEGGSQAVLLHDISLFKFLEQSKDRQAAMTVEPQEAGKQLSGSGI